MVLSILTVSSFLSLGVTLYGEVVVWGCFQFLVFGNKAAIPRNVKVFGHEDFRLSVCLLFVSHGSVARIGMALSHGRLAQAWHFRKRPRSFPKCLSHSLISTESCSSPTSLPTLWMVNFQNFGQSNACVVLFPGDRSTASHMFFHILPTNIEWQRFPLIFNIFQVCHCSQHAFVSSGHALWWMTYRWWNSKGRTPRSATWETLLVIFIEAILSHSVGEQSALEFLLWRKEVWNISQHTE